MNTFGQTTPGEVGVHASRRRLAWIVVAVVLLVVVATWVIVARRSERTSNTATTARGADGTQGMAGMSGMQGMDMSSDGSVHLTSEEIRQFGVTFGSVEERILENAVRTVGTVMVDETATVQVTPKFAGYVERLYVNATGQPVRRGQPLAAIYSPELVAAQEELLLAAQLDRTVGQSAVPGVPASSTDLLGAAKRRLRLWDISEAQIDEVLRTGHAQRTLTLYSPVTGVVTDKKIVQGQAIQAGEAIYTVSNLSEVWVEAEVREADAGFLRQGSSARVEFTSFPGRPFMGRVAYVYPTVELESRTLRARIVIPNREGLLKPGMYATVNLSAPTRRALVVPSSAVVRTGERSVVFVDMGGGTLMPREVETGRVAAGYTEVLSGLEPGQRVVTSAQFLLDSESNLGEVMKSMISQGSAAGMDEMKGIEIPPAAATPVPR